MFLATNESDQVKTEACCNTHDERLVLALREACSKEKSIFKRLFYNIFIFLKDKLRIVKKEKNQLVVSLILEVLTTIKDVDFIKKTPFLRKSVEWARFCQAISLLTITIHNFIERILQEKFEDAIDCFAYFEPEKETIKKDMAAFFKIKQETIREYHTSHFINPIIFFSYLENADNVIVHKNTSEEDGKNNNEDPGFNYFYSIINLEIPLELAQKHNYKQHTCSLFIVSAKGNILAFTKEEIPPFDLILLMKQEILKQYSGNLISIEDGRNIDFHVIGIDEPKLYDEDLLAAIKPMCINALERNEKIGFILYGKHGVSKTSTIYKLIKDLDILALTFEEAERAHRFLQEITGKKILLLEDIDTKDHETKTKEFPRLLKLLDSSTYDILIMSTNSDEIDPSLLRPGRCDRKIPCSLPDPQKREIILKKMINIYNNVKYDPTIIKTTNDFTHAELNSLVRLTSLADMTLVDYIEIFKKENEFHFNEL